MRSQALAVFFSIGEGVGGALAPTVFGVLISEKNRESIFIGYMIGIYSILLIYHFFQAASLMFIGGIVGFFFGINAENKSLEEIAQISKS